MKLPQIRIESTFAKIGLQIIPPVQEIEQPPAELFIQQPPAEMMIDVVPGRLTIDQSQAWADMDLKHVFQRIEEAAQEGYQSWLAYLETVSQQGDELMKIENGGNPIVLQAQVNSEDPPLEFNIGFVPSPFSVKIHYDPAKLMMDWKVNKPIIDVQRHAPIINYKQGKVNIDIAQHNSLHIDIVV
jgi:hypothetical protein